MWTDLSSLLSQFTCVTDRRTDRILIAIPHLHYMQRGKNEKKINTNHTITHTYEFKAK